jgi:hypothetical protein
MHGKARSRMPARHVNAVNNNTVLNALGRERETWSGMDMMSEHLKWRVTSGIRGKDVSESVFAE